MVGGFLGSDEGVAVVGVELLGEGQPENEMDGRVEGLGSYWIEKEGDWCS